MKKILLLALFVSTFALLAGAVYGQDESTDGSAVSSDPGALPAEMGDLPSAMMKEPEASADLASDPDLQAIAGDPRIMAAAKSLRETVQSGRAALESTS